MAIKSVKLEDKTRVLLNVAKAKILQDNPQIPKITDDLVIQQVLEKYVRG